VACVASHCGGSLIYIENISLLLDILGPEKRADIAPRGATERVVYRLTFVLQQKTDSNVLLKKCHRTDIWALYNGIRKDKCTLI
jgi:hypothetical protein